MRDVMPLVLVFALGCGPAMPDGATEPGSAGAARIAGDDGTTGSGYDAPPHRFSPRPHPPHPRVAPATAGDLGALPALVTRFERCYGAREKNEQQIASGPPAHRPGSAKAGGGRKGRPAKRDRSSSSRAKSSSGSATGADLDGLLGGAGAGGSVAPASPAPPPAAEPAADMSAAFAQPSAAPMGGAEEAESAPAEAARIAGDDELDDAPRDGEAREDAPPAYEDWGAAIYLSNDDTMSLSSAQRVIYAIDNFLPLPLEHIRPHELLNYFAFETAEVEAADDFSVLADIAPDPREEGIYTLALSVSGRPVTKADRRNAALTLVIDRSGSMSDEGRMSYLKQGLRRMTGELKRGDVVHLVAFDHEVCAPLENFVVGRDDPAQLERAIDLLQPRGSTDLHRGLTRGYEIADASYLGEHTNRVILITDALTNTGVTDEQMISTVSKYYDSRRIRLSGVGVGRDFNDSLLDRLTERGKGAYVFLGSAAEVDAVFGPRFISLIETVANDVHFRLHLPPSLRMNVFYGEESSTVKEDVQAIHYFANTSQLFLSDLMARGGALRPEDEVMLTVEYEDPETGEELFEERAFNLKAATGEEYNIRKGRLIMAWIDLLAQMASRPMPGAYHRSAGSWEDGEGYRACEDGHHELRQLARGLEDDPESSRVLGLWEKFCSRYERPRDPVRRRPVGDESSWPAAREGDDPR